MGAIECSCALSLKKWSKSSAISSGLSSGREVKRNDIEPVEKIGTELPGLGHRFQIAITGGDHSDINFDFIRAAETGKGFLLDSA